MKGLPVELLLVLLFVAVTIFNVLMQRAAQRRKQAQAAEAPPAPEGADEVPASPRPTAAPAPAVATTAPRRATEVPPAPRAPPARSPLRAARRRLLAGRRGLQEAIVVATILGRCRADEPHGQREVGSGGL